MRVRTPSGKIKQIGNPRLKKNVALTIAAHPGVKYVATITLHPPLDFMNKVRKGLDAGAPAFIQVLTPCPKGWFFDPKHTVKLSRLALDTGAWVSWEYRRGKFSLSYKPTRRQHMKEYIRMQGRFSHLKDEQVDMMDRMVAQDWNYWQQSERENKLVLPWSETVQAI